MNFVSLSVIGLTYECQVMEAASWFSCGFGSTCQDLGTKEAEPREPGCVTTLSGTEFVRGVIIVSCFTHPEE